MCRAACVNGRLRNKQVAVFGFARNFPRCSLCYNRARAEICNRNSSC